MNYTQNSMSTYEKRKKKNYSTLFQLQNFNFPFESLDIVLETVNSLDIASTEKDETKLKVK